jgi:pimeloyl-ACP methyl ester carboxylesterase
MTEYRNDRIVAPLSGRLSRRATLRRAGGAGVALAAARLSRPSASASQLGVAMAQSTPTANTAPTVVLVHGAFADGSSWAGVIARLQAAGVAVVAPANPLRGLAADSAYLASYLAQVPGPVLLAGHSYGGAVIGNAAAQAANVVGLVFVAAFAPAVGEVLGQVAAGSKDSLLGTAQLELKYPTGQGAATASEFVVDPAKFHAVFAADLPAEQAAVLAAAQRPVAAAAFTDPTTGAAWQTLPSWAAVATGDRAAGTDVVRAQAERAKAAIVEVAGSHLIMVSQPQAVTDVILKARAAVG